MATDTTLAQLRELVAEYDAAVDEARMEQLHGALISARPTEPSAMAAWLRWATAPGLNVTGAAEGVEHIAAQLEAGSVLLNRHAVEAIKDALRAAIQHHGGDFEAKHEPGLSEEIAELENKARVALAVLHRGGYEVRDFPATIA